MSRRPSLRALALALALAGPVCVAVASAPAQELTEPPLNDNYLFPIQPEDETGDVPLEFNDTRDTTFAGTQQDLFVPAPDGFPGNVSGGRERTTCDGKQYGKTIWYDFQPRANGSVEIAAVGFDAVVALYEWDPQSNRITRRVGCSSESAGRTETLLANVVGGRAYTVQLGGIGGVGGTLDFNFAFFRNRDGDAVLDASDDCPDTPGIPAAGGCPPRLNVNAPLAARPTNGGVRILSAATTRLPAGTRVEARCCGGARQVVRAKNAGRVQLNRLVGRFAPNGSRIEVFVTHARERRGRFLYGAVGKYVAYPVRGDSVTRIERCLPPGSLEPTSCGRAARQPPNRR